MIPTDQDAWVAHDPTACPKCGSDSCDDPDHLPPPPPAGSTATATATAAPARLAFRAAVDVMHAQRPVEIVEGIAWAGCLSVLVSESGILLHEADDRQEADPARPHGAAVPGHP